MKIVHLTFLSVLARLVLPLSKIHVDPSTGHFMDEVRRVRMFRGINAVNKDPPYYFDALLNRTIVKELSDMGMNIVRLGSLWGALQPEGPNRFNETYAVAIESTVKTLEDHKIYTLLDAHQDGLFEYPDSNISGKGYWALPKWVKQKLVKGLHEYPWPLKQASTPWFCRYLTEQVANSLGRLYQNYDGTLDDFARFWKYIATRFKKYKSVIGYELLNEPFAPDIYKDTLNLLPGITGKKYLKGFDERLQATIRKEDDESIIFWEPLTYAYFVNLPPNLNDNITRLFKSLFPKRNLVAAVTILCGDLQDDWEKILEGDPKGYVFPEVGASCVPGVLPGIESEQECRRAAKSSDSGPGLAKGRFIKTRGPGTDLPRGCIWDNTIPNNPCIYWNPNGVARSRDRKIRPICRAGSNSDSSMNITLSHTKTQNEAPNILKNFFQNAFGKRPASMKTSSLSSETFQQEPSVLGPGVTESPGGAIYSNRSAMSWHYYCWALGTSGTSEAYDPLKKLFCDHLMGPVVFNTATKLKNQIGGGQMLTEWGLCHPEMNKTNSQDTIECNFVMEKAEQYFTSWIYWDTSDAWGAHGFSDGSFFLNDGTVNQNSAIFFARPYPIATAGMPVKLEFNIWKKFFRYEFMVDRNTSHERAKRFPTEIFVPKLQYPNKKYVIKMSKDITWIESPQNEHIIQVFPIPASLSTTEETSTSWIVIKPQP